MKLRRNEETFDVTPEALQHMLQAGSVQETDVCVSTDEGASWVSVREALAASAAHPAPASSTPPPSIPAPAPAPAACAPSCEESCSSAGGSGAKQSACDVACSLESVTVPYLDRALKFLGEKKYLEIFSTKERCIATIGFLGIYTAGILGFLVALVCILRHDVPTGMFFGYGLAFLFGAVVVHYLAWKFLPRIGQILEATPTRISSKNILDCFAVLFMLAGIGIFVLGTWTWIEAASFEAFLMGLFIAVLLEYMASICINPALVNVEVSETTGAGEEFIGILSFLVKSVLKLTPILFGVGVVLGNLMLLKMFLIKPGDFANREILVSATAAITYLSTALLPLTGYLAFLTYYFLIDLAGSILSIRRIERVVSKQED